MSRLRLDLTCLTDAGVGAAGVSAADLERIAPRAAAAVERLLALRAAGTVGFLDLPDDAAGVAPAAQAFAAGLAPEIDNLVVLGIGGSSLGPRALYSALAPAYHPLRPRAPGGPRRLWFPDNSDPRTFAAVLELCPPERTVWNVVTKSGGTAETASQLLVLYQHLTRALGEAGARASIVVTTDPEKGALRALVRDLGLTSFPVPPSVGGRFSVLSAVGLVPAAAAGLDVAGLLAGARAMRDRCLGKDLGKNPALLLATLLHLHDVDNGRPMAVVMPYADALFDTADWFRQLWAESLGKALDVDGKPIVSGPTPIASRGATDQHSQLQLYAEGPPDKTFLFLRPRQRDGELTMPDSVVARHPDYAYLVGRGMGELLDAELRGTLGSLVGRGRPCGLVELERLDAGALGELLMLLMTATALAGPLYRVDPFDQPGVEEAKKLAFAALGRPGYESFAAALGAATSDPRYVL
jgi:glucose-6-phosphate isomerase